jgi:hypothetical protein
MANQFYHFGSQAVEDLESAVAYGLKRRGLQHILIERPDWRQGLHRDSGNGRHS